MLQEFGASCGKWELLTAVESFPKQRTRPVLGLKHKDRGKMHAVGCIF